MSYELTINRVMALCEIHATRRRNDALPEGDELIKAFRTHTEFMFRRKLAGMYETIVEAGRSDGIEIEPIDDRGLGGSNSPPNEDTNAEEDFEIFHMPANAPYVPANLSRRPSDHLVGLFRSQKFIFKSGTMPWMLRVRPSMTACALERTGGLPKLWWTFEGVPASGPDHRPTDREAAGFLSATNVMATAGLDALRDAYRAGLSEVKIGSELEMRPERIRINLSDNNGRPLAELVDAMHLKGATFAEVENSDAYGEGATTGAKEVTAFLDQVTGGLSSCAKKLRLDAEMPNMKAVLCEYEAATTVGGNKNTDFVVAGVARSSSMRGGYEALAAPLRQVETSEEFIRANSAARPLSAMLASQQALLLDDRLTAR